VLNIQGLSLDTRNLKGQGWAWAKNILVTKGFRSIANEDGAQLEKQVNGKILGTIPTNLGTVVFSRNGSICEIGYFELGIYTTICKDTVGLQLLQFQWDCPIEGIFKYNWKGDLIISFWDGTKTNSNRPRLLNLTNLPFPVNGSKEFTSSNAQNLMLLYPDMNIPNYAIGNIKPGGDIDPGVYYLVTSYEVSEDDQLNWMLPSHPFPIAKYHHDSFILNTDNGNDFKVSNLYQESKQDGNSGVSIDITIDNIDTRFKYIKLAAIKEVNKVKTAIYIDKFEITGTQINFVWTGKFKGDLTPDEILIDSVNYTRFKTGTYNNKRLCAGNLKTQEELRFQKYANNISVSWFTESIEDLTQANALPPNIFQSIYKRYEWYANPGNCLRVRTLKPWEVYAFYAHAVYKDGTIGKGMHIPGREVQQITIGATAFDEDETVTNAVAAEPAEFGADEAALGVADSAKLFHTRDTANINHPVSGKYPGYWENEDETYPNLDEYDGTIDYDGNAIAGGIDLRGQKVRHHRMPGLKTMYGGTSFANLNKFIKIRFHNIEIPQYLKDQIQGIVFSYAIKTLDNSTVLGTSPIYREAMYGNDTTLSGPDLNGFYTPGTVISNAHARLYDIPLLHNTPSVNARYIKGEYISTNVNSPVSLGNPPGPVLTGPGLTGVPDTTGTTWIADNLAYRAIKKFEYIPENNSATVPISNNTREACIRATFENTSTDLLSRYRIRRGFDNANDQGDELNYPGSDHDEVKVNLFYFAVGNIMSMIKNVHTNFYEQDLALASKLIHPVNAGVNGPIGGLFNFDTFITGYSIKHNFYSEAGTTYYPANTNWENDLSVCTHIDGDEALENTHIINTALGLHFRFPCYSNYNYVLNRGNDFSQIPSHLLMGSGKKNLGFNAPNKWSVDIDYDPSYSSIMNLKFPGSWSPYDRFIDKLPYRVARTDVTQDEEKSESWRKFRANEYHEGEKDKGEVWKLETLDKTLIIHQKYSLYTALNKDKLSSDITEVYIGTGDVFDRPPQNVLPTREGYAGNQSQWASFTCKLGYVFLDRQQGKIFIFDGALKEISNLNVRNWMRANTNTTLDIDNPFTEFGLTAAFDEQFNRVIISKNDIRLNDDVIYHGILSPDIDEDQIGDAFLVDGNIVILEEFDEDDNPIYRPLVENHIVGEPGGPQALVGDFVYKKWTISYSPEINQGQGGWVSFHDYYPNHLFHNRSGIYAINNTSTLGRIFKHNIKTIKGIYYDATVYPSYWDMIHNESPEVTKIVESVTWVTEVEVNETRFFNETLTHICLYNTDQCTGIIAVPDLLWFQRNNRFIEGSWNYNEIRDMVINKNNPIINEDRSVNTINIAAQKTWFKKDNLLGKFVIVRYIYDNNIQKDFYFHDSIVNYMQNFR